MGAIAGFQLHTVSITTEDKGMADVNLMGDNAPLETKPHLDLGR